MKIFVSYGHEIGVKNPATGRPYPELNNESFVRKFVEYLQKNDVDVWFDHEKLEPSVDWREKIVEGVSEADVAIVFLTPKAVARKNCVCRDEIDVAVDRSGRSRKDRQWGLSKLSYDETGLKKTVKNIVPGSFVR